MQDSQEARGRLLIREPEIRCPEECTSAAWRGSLFFVVGLGSQSKNVRARVMRMYMYPPFNFQDLNAKHLPPGNCFPRKYKKRLHSVYCLSPMSSTCCLGVGSLHNQPGPSSCRRPAFPSFYLKRRSKLREFVVFGPRIITRDYCLFGPVGLNWRDDLTVEHRRMVASRQDHLLRVQHFFLSQNTDYS